MYNEAIKQEFLQYVSDEKIYKDVSRESCRYRLEQFSDTEELLKKDLYDFRYNDFKFLFERNMYVNKATIWSSKSILNRYVEWASKMGYCNSDTINELKRLKSEDINPMCKIQTQMFADENDLFDCIKGVLSQQDQTAITIYQAFYGLYWNGLLDEEIFYLKKTDVTGNEIKTRKDIIVVSDRLAEAIKEYKEQDYVIIDSKRYELNKSQYLIRAIERKDSREAINENFHSQRRYLWNRELENVDIDNQYYGKTLKPKQIEKSGNFYRAYSDEKAGKKITQSNITDYFRNDRKYSKNFGYNTFRDYEKWRSYYCE